MIIESPEGATPLEPEEMEGLIHKHVTQREELDQLEQANITEGMRWLTKQNAIDVLTEYFIRELHKRLFGAVWSWAGKYRTTEKNIGVAPYRIVPDLGQLLGDVKFWIENETYSPLEIAARFHHRLVYIHPFPNGNGRHSRIIANAVLMKCLGQPGIDWAGGLSLDKMGERRSIYIQALKAADQYDLSPLLHFVSSGRQA